MTDCSTIFEEACNKLTNMEEQKKIDLSILDDFAILQKTFSEEEKYWKSSREPIKEAFVFFHSIRNCRMILEKMSLRFQFAKQKHENPKVVYSARLAIPRINDLYNMIAPFRKKRISNELLNLVRQRLKSLRDVAENTSMLPTIDEEVKGVLKSELKAKFEKVAENLQATISEE